MVLFGGSRGRSRLRFPGILHRWDLGSSACKDTVDALSMSAEEYLTKRYSVDFMCEIFVQDFGRCVAYNGDLCVDSHYTGAISKCCDKYHDYFLKHLEQNADRVRGKESANVSLEERCSLYSQVFEETVLERGKHDGLVGLYKRMTSKCPDKFQEVFKNE